jgi:hypothetical protein
MIFEPVQLFHITVVFRFQHVRFQQVFLFLSKISKGLIFDLSKKIMDFEMKRATSGSNLANIDFL